MNKIRQQFGGPTDRTRDYIPEFYCGMCGQIPILETKDKTTNKIAEVSIIELVPVPMLRPDGQQVQFMCCPGCMARIEAKMRSYAKERLKGQIWPFRGPRDNPGGQAGGVTA